MPNPLRDYATITASYWAFTLTDGALRMLVLFHLHQLGYAPLEVASLFLFYEFFGVVTNFVGGYLGARYGLKSTLFVGLSLQVIACGGLSVMADNLSLSVVIVAQALSGIAKDLTKMSSKSYIKLVVPEGDGSRLMRWVALLTGSKNALKGVGFFLGGLLLQTVGFGPANMVMAGALLVALVGSTMLLPRAMGRSRGRVSLRDSVSDDTRIRWLSAARLFLFGSRDVWFVLALPVYLSATLRWTFAESGAFLALWVIGYGIVQAAAPRFVGRERPTASHVLAWTSSLLLPLTATAVLMAQDIAPAITLSVGLAVFGVVFAADSAVHSYLIVHYATADRVALGVGFYYSANAFGRLVGTLLSGAVFQWAGGGSDGLVGCIVASIVFVLLSLACCVPLRTAERVA